MEEVSVLLLECDVFMLLRILMITLLVMLLVYPLTDTVALRDGVTSIIVLLELTVVVGLKLIVLLEREE